MFSCPGRCCGFVHDDGNHDTNKPPQLGLSSCPCSSAFVESKPYENSKCILSSFHPSDLVQTRPKLLSEP